MSATTAPPAPPVSRPRDCVSVPAERASAGCRDLATGPPADERQAGRDEVPASEHEAGIGGHATPAECYGSEAVRVNFKIPISDLRPLMQHYRGVRMHP